ncbi:MAG: extracellular solute-binding protein, partial [Alphaproteobacteria bacterium]
MRLTAAVLAAALLLPPIAAHAESVTISHAIAEFGEPKYGPDFAHFDYADSDAPKGGTVRFARSGSFDSLNSLPIQGEYARSVGLIYDSLMVQAQDDLSVYYPLVAETVEYGADRDWAIFNLRPEARFHDGVPVTAHDVAWSFQAIKDHGQPFLKAQYDEVTAAEVLDDHRIRFRFSTTGVMHPMTAVAQIPIFPRHYWEEDGADRDIGAAFLEPPLASGPYHLVSVDSGRQLVYERVADYWGADLPVQRGSWNFDRIVYDFYRDRTIQFEAFKAGEYHWHRSFSSREWGAGFDFPAHQDGRVARTEFPVINFRGIQGFMFNSRLPLFADI